MATITPALDTTIAGVPRVIWTGVSTADTMVAWKLTGSQALAAAVAFDDNSAWGSSTVKLQASCDGTNYFDMKDTLGNTISATANAMFEFSTAAAYLKPASSGGTADNVDVILVLRGPTNA